eukprot:COSAG04_NODE_12808_length_634_cov_0.906542_2_plen_57_part_01
MLRAALALASPGTNPDDDSDVSDAETERMFPSSEEEEEEEEEEEQEDGQEEEMDDWD